MHDTRLTFLKLLFSSGRCSLQCIDLDADGTVSLTVTAQGNADKGLPDSSHSTGKCHAIHRSTFQI